MKQPSALERFVARLRLRSELSDEEVQAILALEGREVMTKARGIIVLPSETVDVCCLVVQGLLARFDQLADRSRQITALHVAGDMCDMHSVAVPHVGWGIEALSDARTLRIPHQQIREIMRKYPGVALAFWRDTVADASILAKWLSALGRLKARVRLAHLLCELGLRMEWAHLGRRTQFSLPLTQAQLADVLGLTLVHVHNNLRDLQREGLIEKQGSMINIPDLDQLIRVAQFDPAYLLLEEGATGWPAERSIAA